MLKFPKFKLFCTLLNILSLIMIGLSHPLCESSEKVDRVYNIGPNIAIHHSNKIWIYVRNTNKLTDSALSLNQIYGADNFETVDTAFTFDFSFCTNEDEFCNNTKKMQNIVIAIGKKKSSEEYGYLTYRLIDGDLKFTSNDQLIWGLKSDGPLTGIIWIPSIAELTYMSTAFSAKENILYATIKRSSEEKSQVMTRKLDEKGLWSDIWREVGKLEFIGIFVVNDLVYFVDNNETVYKIQWKAKNATFHIKSTAKEMFNCYGNSSIVTKKSDSVLSISTSTSKESKSQTNEPKSMLWVFIAIGFVLLALIGGIGIVVINRRKAETEPKSDKQSGEIEDEPSQSEDSKSDKSKNKAKDGEKEKSEIVESKADRKDSKSNVKRIRSDESVRTVRSASLS